MRVLSIDGGGIRGLIPALVLCEIEQRTGRRIAECFDFIAGTSTGGILACALSLPGKDGRPRYAASEVVGLYETEGPKIFSRSLLKRIFSAQGFVDERYEDAELDAALERYLGDARLSDALVPIMVTAYDIHGRFAFFFRSARAAQDPAYDFPMVDVARATSAAPTYFEPHEVTDVAGARTYPLVDGGVFATNPAACAYADLDGEMTLLASLGTGAFTRRYSFDDARWWGQLQWARPALDIVFDGQAETTQFLLGRLLGDRYLRLQCDLDAASDDMDDASPENLARLREAATELIARESDAIDRLCGRLVCG
jgi:patatin-like phospholipase/acyl hydrolase